MVIKKKLLPVNKYFLKVPTESIGRTPSFIIIHNTDGYASADAEASYCVSNQNATAFNYVVDESEVIQIIPDECGGFSTANREYDVKGISIEICRNLNPDTGSNVYDNEKFRKAEQNAAELCAMLCDKYGWTPEYRKSIRTHQMANGKNCPALTLKLGMGRFVDMIKENMDMNIQDYKTDIKIMFEEFTREQEARAASRAPSKWAEEEIKEAIEAGITDGKRPQSDATREEVAVMVKRAYANIINRFNEVK